jgi:DNA modification methylase
VSVYYSDDYVTLWHGDCREILPRLPSVDLLLTDPPYGVSSERSYVKKGRKGTRNFDFFAGDRDWDAMTQGVVERLALAASKAPTAYVWCGHKQFGQIEALFADLGWKTKFLVWRKECPIPAPPGTGYDSAAELCVYAFQEGRKWIKARPNPSNVIDADSYRHGQPGKVDHPTQKPLATVTVPMLASTEPDDVVLDPFAGSGTTLVAAKQFGRRAIGVELEERYCEVIAKRLAQDVLDFGGVA